MDWRPTRQRLYSIFYVGEMALASWTVGNLAGYHTVVGKLVLSYSFTHNQIEGSNNYNFNPRSRNNIVFLP